MSFLGCHCWRESGQGELVCPPAKERAGIWVAKQSNNALRQGTEVARRYAIAGRAFFNEMPRASDVAHYGREACGHTLRQRNG